MSNLKLDKALNIDLDRVATSPYGLSYNPTNTLSQSPAPSLLSPANYNMDGFNSPMPPEGLSSPINSATSASKPFAKDKKLRHSPFSMPYEGFKRPKNMSLASINCDDVSTKPSTMTSLTSLTKFRVRTILAPQSLTVLPSETPNVISLNNLDAIKKGVKSMNDVGNKETNRESNLLTEREGDLMEIAQLSSIRERAGADVDVEETEPNHLNANIQEVKQISCTKFEKKVVKKVEKIAHNHADKQDEKRCSCVKDRRDPIKTLMKSKTEVSTEVVQSKTKQKKVVLKKKNDGKVVLKKAKTISSEELKERLSLQNLNKVNVIQFKERLTVDVNFQEQREIISEVLDVDKVKVEDEQKPELSEDLKSSDRTKESFSLIPVEEPKLRRIKRKRSLSTGKIVNPAQERIIVRDEIIKPQEDEKEGSIVVMKLLKRTQTSVERSAIGMKVLNKEIVEGSPEEAVQAKVNAEDNQETKKPEINEVQEDKKLSWLKLRKRQHTEELRIEEERQSVVNKEPQMFIQGPNHFFELNMENKFLKEYGSLTNISRDVLTKTPNYTSVPVSQHSHRDKQPRPLKERKADASTVIVRYYDEMEPILIQPKFLEASGSMCVTELWGRKNKKDFYQDMRKALRSNTHLCLDPHYGMYRPEKVTDTETLKRKREANSALVNGKLGIIRQVSAASSPKSAFFSPNVSVKHTRDFVLKATDLKKPRNSVGASFAKKNEL